LKTIKTIKNQVKKLMAAHGGKRKGAGRKKSSLEKKSRLIAEIAFVEGITPLEVMLTAMRAYAAVQEWGKASSIAKDCAPYVHPKLASIEHSGKDGGPLVIERIERVIVDPQHSDTQSFRPAAKTVPQ
jgi:hypothetical protein